VSPGTHPAESHGPPLPGCRNYSQSVENITADFALARRASHLSLTHTARIVGRNTPRSAHSRGASVPFRLREDGRVAQASARWTRAVRGGRAGAMRRLRPRGTRADFASRALHFAVRAGDAGALRLTRPSMLGKQGPSSRGTSSRRKRARVGAGRAGVRGLRARVRGGRVRWGRSVHDVTGRLRARRGPQPMTGSQ
jgi:hypothetical protein